MWPGGSARSTSSRPNSPIPDTIATVAALCAAETACCAQAQFLLEVTASQVILTVKAPPGDGLLQMLLPDDVLIRR